MGTLFIWRQNELFQIEQCFQSYVDSQYRDQNVQVRSLSRTDDDHSQNHLILENTPANTTVALAVIY